jgi:hypothetical protein
MMKKEFNIYIGNENIQNVNIQKLLVIYLDPNLDWKNLINILKSRGIQNGPLCYSIFYRFEVRDVVSNT